MRPRRLLAGLGGLAACCALGGCASRIEVLPLATGRPDVTAYELRGPELAGLRREALRLCPQGAEVLRHAGRDERTEPASGRLARWASATGDWLDPPRREAQLLMRCREQPSDGQLASAAERAAAEATARAQASPPIGPLAVEW